MYSMDTLCSKHVSKLNLALCTLIHHETSVHSCVFCACIPKPITSLTRKHTSYNIVGGKFRGNELNSLKRHVLRVRLHWF